MKRRLKMKGTRSLHQIVVDAFGDYAHPMFISDIFKKDIADKVYSDFCEEYYPPEPTTADEYNEMDF